MSAQPDPRQPPVPPASPASPVPPDARRRLAPQRAAQPQGDVDAPARVPPAPRKAGGAPKRKRRPVLTSNEREIVLWAAVERFVRGWSAQRIVDDVFAETGIDVSREAIYPLMETARKRNLIVLTPPPERVLSDRLTERAGEGEVHVVNSFGVVAPESVADYAAERALEIITRLGRERSGGAVHIAFGVGRMTHNVVRHLAARLDPVDAPPLVVHPLSPSYSLHDPCDTPLTALDDLRRAARSVVFTDLPAPPFVQADDYDTLFDNKAIKPAFDRAGEIDLLITSMADRADEHGYLRGLLEHFDPAAVARLDELGWIGDVHLCPFGTRGPLEIKQGLKPVTLFQFQELVEMARRRDTHIMLLGSACGTCQRSKKAALKPLLERPELRCWHSMIVDRTTAIELLE